MEEKIEDLMNKVCKRVEARCKEILSRDGILTRGDALRVLYEELCLSPTNQMACETHGYSWETIPVMFDNDGHPIWRFEP